MGSLFILSDIDIQFFRGFEVKEIEKSLIDSSCEILFQRETSNPESYEVNTGFYIARCGDFVANLLRDAIEECAGHGIANDQIAVNTLLKREERGSKWDMLPATCYARSHGFPPPTGILLHHANFTSTVQEKHEQLLAVRSYVEGGMSDRFKVILRELFRYIGSGDAGGMILRKIRKFSTPPKQ